MEKWKNQQIMAYAIHSLVAAIALIMSMGNQAFAAESKLFTCVPSAAETNSLNCPLDILPPAKVNRIALVDKNGTEQSQSNTKFIAGGGPEAETSVAVLLSESANLNPNEFARLKGAISTIIGSQTPYVHFGLWSFGAKLQQVSPFGTSSDTVKLAIQAVRSDAKAVELLHSIAEVTKQLAAEQSSRKVLILAATPEFDDVAYDLQEILESLKKENVRVFVVYPKKGDNALVAAQILQRLSDETSGTLFQAYDQATVQQASATIQTFLQQSGVVKVKPTDNPETLQVELSNGKILSTDVPANILTDAQKSAASANPNHKDTSGSSATVPASGVQQWPYALLKKFINMSFVVKLALILAAIAGLGVLGFLTKGLTRNRATKSGVGINSVPLEVAKIGDMRPVLAWFVFLDSSETQEPVHEAVTRIGRHPDNDLVLSNSTVHRHHAVLKRENDGGFSLMDLNTSNGINVNGKRVTRCDLKDGDTVELGEVRMRFRLS